MKIFFMPSSRGGSAKNLYTTSERMTFSCRVTWDWAASVNLCSGQITLSAQTKYMLRNRSSGHRSGGSLYPSMNHRVNRAWWRRKRILDIMQSLLSSLKPRLCFAVGNIVRERAAIFVERYVATSFSASFP